MRETDIHLKPRDPRRLILPNGHVFTVESALGGAELDVRMDQPNYVAMVIKPWAGNNVRIKAGE